MNLHRDKLAEMLDDARGDGAERLRIVSRRGHYHYGVATLASWARVLDRSMMRGTYAVYIRLRQRGRTPRETYTSTIAGY